MKNIIDLRIVAGGLILGLIGCSSSVIVGAHKKTYERNQETIKLSLNPDDVLQLKLCKGTVMLFDLTDTISNSKDIYFSELQPRTFFICPCADTTRYSKGYYYDSAFEGSATKELLNKYSVKSSRKAPEVVKEDAVSMVNFVLSGLKTSKEGFGAMLVPEKPIFFEQRGWLTAYNNPFKNPDSMVYRGHQPWKNFWDPVPMNVAFGSSKFDLNLVRVAFPIIWKKDSVNNGRKNDSTYIRAYVIRDPDYIQGVALNTTSPYTEFSREYNYAKIQNGIRNGDILELVFVRNEKDSVGLYHLVLMSHHFLERSSPSNRGALIPVGKHLSLPHYPNREPYYVEINHQTQGAITGKGIQVFAQDTTQSFSYATHYMSKTEARLIKGFPNRIDTIYLQPKGKKPWHIRLNPTNDYVR